jgi:glutamate-ammonia-ligase adenylyltransferase
LAARAELYGQYNALRIGRFLADIAEVIITEVVARACHQLSSRYPDIMRIKSHFAVIAYGKLGAREMNYDSDVDLVFLHTANLEDESLVTRLTQKILHMLTTRTQTGILYAVDTRLRPSGSAGLLVSHLDAFMDYQRSQAWTWEHQSLLRARALFANPRIRAAFIKLKKDILFMPRERKTLGDDVQLMRAKIDKHVEGNAVKHEAGGLLDLEFLIQYLVLAHPADNVVRNTNTLMQLKILRDNHVVNNTQFAKLKRAYQHYHRALHQLLLQSDAIKSDNQQADVLEISLGFYQSS